VATDWRKLHTEEFHNLYAKYYQGDQIKECEMGLACSTRRRADKCVQNIGWKPKGKRPLGRTRRRWEDNIRLYLRDIGWERVD
jgi:hypothetical protein